MQRYISTILVLLLCALLFAGCKASTPSVPPPGTTPPADGPNALVTVYLITEYAYEGKETAFVYDEAGRLLEVSVNAQVVVAYRYDDQGNCLSYKNTLEGIDQTYDPQGNLLTDRTEDGLITNTYNDAGLCIQVERRNADGTLLSVTHNTYDEQGNLLSEVVEQDGIVHHEILHTYDEEGRHLTATYCRDGVMSAEGPSYVWEYEPLLGHLTREKIYYGEELIECTGYEYYAKADCLLAFYHLSRDGSTHRFSYFFHRVTGYLTQCTETFQHSDGTLYTNYYTLNYDTNGNLTTLEYDDHAGLDRYYHWYYEENPMLMTGCSLSSAEESFEYAWIYDAKGNKVIEIRAGDDPHKIVWEYDRQGSVVSMVRTGTSPQETTYVYDEYGNLIQRSHTVGSVTAVRDYTYTAITVTPEVAAQLLAQQKEILQQLNGA